MSIDKYYIHIQGENKSRDTYKPYGNEGGLGPGGNDCWLPLKKNVKNNMLKCSAFGVIKRLILRKLQEGFNVHGTCHSTGS